MATSQEVGVQSWIMEESLKNNCLVACLAHVPDATSATTGTRISVGIVPDIDLGG